VTDELWRDVRFAARMLRRAPGFTLVAVATLALGIGANTAIFSVVNALLLRPLPYPDADRLVFLTEWSEQVPEMSFSVANLKDLRDQNTVFESLVGSNGQDFTLAAVSGTGGLGEPERVSGRQVTSGMFATLGKRPIVGRAFGPEEEKAGAAGVVLLGEGFWERRSARPRRRRPSPGAERGELHRDRRDAEGAAREPEADGRVHPAPAAGGPDRRRVEPRQPPRDLRDRPAEAGRGRRPGACRGEDDRPGAGRAVPGLERAASDRGRSLDSVVGELRPALMLLLWAVALVLLIACANVANLLLARAADRQREVAVRLAMGATRGRILRQLLTESVLLSLLGGLVGVALAYAGLEALVASLPGNVPRADEVGIDVSVLVFTAAVAVVTGLAFGIVPAWRTLSIRLHEPLKEAGRGSVGPGHHRVRNTLVVAEVAMALVLLVGAGLLLRSFFRVLHATRAPAEGGGRGACPATGSTRRGSPSSSGSSTSFRPGRASRRRRSSCRCSAGGRARSAWRGGPSPRRASVPPPTSPA
jgi:putative ABC transport system permease protein